jgi:hypothetical protein
MRQQDGLHAREWRIYRAGHGAAEQTCSARTSAYSCQEPTHGVECSGDGEVLTHLRQAARTLLPKPGVRLLFLRLTSNRLLQNMAQLEASIEQNKDVIEQNKGRLHADAV